MKVIELYILRRALAIFLAAMAWLLVIVWTTQVLNRIDLVTSNGQSAATFFTVALLALPSVVPVIMPFVIGIAVAQTLATMNADSELAVLSAAGSSRLTILRPVLLIAVTASIAAFAINNTLEPYARQTMRQILAKANADLITTVLSEGTFHKVADGLFVQVSERLPNGQLGGIFVADTRDKDLKLIYHARRGATVDREEGSILVMQDGEVHRERPGGEVSVIRFNSYAFDLSEFTNGSGKITLYPKDRYLPDLLNPDPNDKYYISRPQTLRAELHMRFSEWLYPVVFALIGVAVAGDARSFREARLHPMITTMAVGLLVRWAGFYAGNEAETKPLFTVVLYAVPIGMIVVCSFFIAGNKVMELPTAWTEDLWMRLKRLHARFSRSPAPGGQA
ncbi:LPS export ABC transporter permease LptF [Chelativorans sp. Marseille-P2723]|uniref:LPS export ABC transporter permease LptF n=1 Tax=Chelativorans sp. Marseille-P2723 TaxID=2709133 RepID=UPI00157151F5|nr:LPS export ABC transporter permease LptF [Chelativorans sp. Marseille-P2723]